MGSSHPGQLLLGYNTVANNIKIPMIYSNKCPFLVHDTQPLRSALILFPVFILALRLNEKFGFFSRMHSLHVKGEAEPHEGS